MAAQWLYTASEVSSAIDAVMGTTIALLDQITPTCPLSLQVAYRRERLDLLYVADELRSVLSLPPPKCSPRPNI